MRETHGANLVIFDELRRQLCTYFSIIVQNVSIMRLYFCKKQLLLLLYITKSKEMYLKYIKMIYLQCVLVNKIATKMKFFFKKT